MPKSSQHHSSSRSKTRSAAADDPPGSSSASRSSSNRHARSQAGPALPTPSTSNAKDHMDAIHERTNQTDNEELAIKRKLVPRLAKRAYHLEDDNTWCQDWIQYQRNTHPVFGLCLYHRFHPIRLPQRVIILVGSIAFGFAMTNLVYLGFLANEQAGNVTNTVYNFTGTVSKWQEEYTKYELQQSMVFLLTVGSFLHSAFDMAIWYLMACFCFRPGGICQGSMDSGGKCRPLCQNFGIYFAVMVVMAAVVAATSVAVIRLNADEEQEANTMAEEFADSQLDGEGTAEAEDDYANRWAFLIGYFLELTMALFVFYPLTSTMFFSGILGCGRLPVIGGRPYEMWKARLKEERKKNKNGEETSENEEDFDEEDVGAMMFYEC